MRLVVLGPPGAGKGTQASHLARDLGVPHIATGDMFRTMARADTPTARSLKACLDAGELIPDTLTNQLVRERLAHPDAAGGFVFDGYPRNTDQARVLDRALARNRVGLDHAVKFMVTGPEIVARLAGRLACPVDGSVYHPISHPPRVPGICDLDGAVLRPREDDREDTVLRRLEVYGERTKPVYDYYADQGILETLDAIGTAEEVYERLLKVLGLERLIASGAESSEGPEAPGGPEASGWLGVSGSAAS